MAKATPKPKTVKKAAAGAKGKVSGGGASGSGGERADLAKELKTLIPKLDEEGLAFLVKQAHVHLYNMQVDALNKTLIKEDARKKVSAAKKPAKTAERGFSEVKMSETGSSYYIIYNNEWIAFAKDEMTAIVKIALDSGTEIEIRERLFNWFSRERSDLLYSAAIADKFDDKLKSLIDLLKDNFKLKNK